MEIDWKKKYNEALEKIKRYTTDKYGCTRLKPADIFPELSNDDERMKKAIIDALNSHNNSINLLSSRGYSMDDVITYLEKQKNPSFVYDTHDYVSAKKQGWEQYSKKNFSDNQSKSAFEKGFEAGYMFGIHEEKPFVWTKHDEAVREEAIACLEDWKGVIPVGGFADYKNILAWLKEELLEKQKEQKQDWSDEDEEIFNLTIIHLLSYAYPDNPIYCEEAEKCVAWFKSLKNRGNFSKGSANSPNVWSDEDEWARNYLIEHLTNGMWIGEESERKLVTWLKSFRPQPKQEWSKIDEHMSNGLIKALENLSSDWLKLHGVVKSDIIAWLKCHHNHLSWKPSDEQMRQLEYVAEQNKHNMLGKELMTLYDDLKKLI